MDFLKPFTYLFEDPDWLKKIAILALLGFAQLIPVIGSLFMAMVFSGVMVDIVRKVINKETPTLPTLDIGTQFMDGLKLWVINLVYSVPMIVLGIITAIIIALGITGGVLGADSDNAGAVGAVAVIVFSLLACLVLIMLLYGLLIALITPEITARYAKFGTIGSALKFKEVFKTVFKKPVPYLLSYVGVVLVGFVGGIALPILSIVGAIALLIGSLYGIALVTVFISLATGHFYGQAHNVATEEIA